MRVEHPWKPIYDCHSQVLILGTIPSRKSREVNFYYGHPQNIFWQTVAEMAGDRTPDADAGSRTAFLLKNRIAVWDVLASCEIEGALDSTIRNPQVNCFRPLLQDSKIHTIFTTGRKATDLFNRYCSAEAGMQAIYLPSTSPANRAMHGRPEFRQQWGLVRNALACITAVQHGAI